MPAGDGTGPRGLGPMTGRAAGYCVGYPAPGYMNPAAGRWPAAFPVYGAPYPPAGYGPGFRLWGWAGRRLGRGRGGRGGRGRWGGW